MRPDHVIGHSIGEIAAAHVAGVFDLADAAALVGARARLMETMPTAGAMAALAASEAEVAPLLAGREAEIGLAAVNGAEAVVVSGEQAAVEAVVAHFKAQGRKATPLNTRHAYHSPHTEPILADFRAAISGLTYRVPALPVVSNLTGTAEEPAWMAGADYWADHVRRAVLFHEGITYLRSQNTVTFVELGPGSALATAVQQSVPDTEVLVTPTLNTRSPEPQAFLEALARIHAHGRTVDFSPAWPAPARPTDLPTYPFQRQRYWLMPAAAASAHGGGHPLLGRRLSLAGSQERRYSQRVTREQPWFLDQHRVAGAAVLPGAALAEWALAAVRAGREQDAAAWRIRDIGFRAFLAVEERRATALQAVVTDGPDGVQGVRCFARPDGDEAEPWTENAVIGAVEPAPDAPADGPCGPEAPGKLQAGMTEHDPAALYARCARLGLSYGPAFRGIRRLWRSPEQALGLIEVADASADQGAYLLHPVVFDICVHLCATFVYGPDAAEGDPDTVWLPSGIDEVRVYAPLPAKVWCVADWRGRHAGEAVADLRILNEDGDVVAEADGLRLRALARTALTDLVGGEPPAYEAVWLPAEEPEDLSGRAAAGPTLVCGTDPEVAGLWNAEIAASGLDALIAPDVQGAAASAARLVLHAGAALDDGDTAERAVELTKRSAAQLRAFLAASPDPAAAIVIVTTGAADVPGREQPPAPEQAAVAGLATALIAELPDRKVVHLDLEPGSPESLAGLLARAEAVPGSGRLARGGGSWYQARLRERDATADGPGRIPVRADGTYLVTGGLSGLGLATAERLALRGARSLVLVGRRRPAEEPPALAALRAAGVRVEILTADVADAAQVAELLRTVRAGMPPLRGVVHSAGVLDDALFSELDDARFEAVLRPKVAGAWNLHQGTAGDDLDFFVLYSSVVALIGSAAQANYIAANSFLDALARRRRAAGLPGLSLGWGPWAEHGMAARGGLVDRFAARGLTPIATAGGLAALEHLAGTGAAHAGVVAVDWPVYLADAARTVPDTLFADLGADAARDSAALLDAQALTELVVTDTDAAREAVFDGLLELAARLLGIPEAGRRELRPTFPRVRLGELGLDSLTTVQLRRRILAAWSVDVSPDLLFGGGTVAEVAEEVCRQLIVRSVAGDAPGADDADLEVLTL